MLLLLEMLLHVTEITERFAWNQCCAYYVRCRT